MKKTKTALLLCVFLAQLLFVPVTRAGEDTVSTLRSSSLRSTSPAQVQAAFGKKCEEMLIEEIDRARMEILVAIYSITRKSTTSALVQAAQRGVKVRVKYDARSYEEKGMQHAIGYMKKRRIECTPVKMTDEYAKMHHKFVVIDGKRVLTGSFNYTTSASKLNYENLVLIDSADVARAFASEFERIESR